MAIGVSPDKLEFSLRSNETQSLKVFVQNLDSDALTIQTTTADFQNLVSIEPSEAQALPQKIVPIVVTIKGQKNFKTHLAIKSLKPSEADFQIQTGIQIPLRVEVETTAFWFIPLVGAIMVVTIVFFFRKKAE